MHVQTIAAHIYHLAGRPKSAIVSRTADSLIRNTQQYKQNNKTDELAEQSTYGHFHKKI